MPSAISLIFVSKRFLLPSGCLTRAITHQSSSLHKSSCKIARWDGVGRSKSNQLGAPTIDKHSCTNVERTGTGSHDGRKRRVDLLFLGGFEENDLLPHSAGRLLDLARLRVMRGKIGVL